MKPQFDTFFVDSVTLSMTFVLFFSLKYANNKANIFN